MKRVALLLFVNIAAICTIIVGIEVAGQIAFRIIRGEYIFKGDQASKVHKQVFEIHPYLAGRIRKNVVVGNNDRMITSTNINTRWTGSPQEDSGSIKVAVLGGSTTFGTGVSDKDSWPALLQAKLGNKFSVINYGVPGYSTVEAIIQMALLLPEIEPDYVVLYQGWNDIRNYHETDLGVDYYSHGMRQYGNLSLPAAQDIKPIDHLISISATARLAKAIQQRLGNSEVKKSYVTYTTPDPFVDKLYIRNLKTIKVLSKHLGSFAIFIPQVLNSSAFEKRNVSREWTPHIEDAAVPMLMDHFNSLMQSICSNTSDSECLYLGKVLDERWKPEDFVDDGHFSKIGNELFAGIVSQAIVNRSMQSNNNTQRNQE